VGKSRPGPWPMHPHHHPLRAAPGGWALQKLPGGGCLMCCCSVHCLDCGTSPPHTCPPRVRTQEVMRQMSTWGMWGLLLSAAYLHHGRTLPPCAAWQLDGNNGECMQLSMQLIPIAPTPLQCLPTCLPVSQQWGCCCQHMRVHWLKHCCGWYTSIEADSHVWLAHKLDCTHARAEY
jgi:hypothetical protein